jgi:citrate synthase
VIRILHRLRLRSEGGLLGRGGVGAPRASYTVAVCYIDGEAGVLEYHGYPIADLCEKSIYLEVAYLLIYGELPTQEQLDEWVFEITHHTFVHENMPTDMFTVMFAIPRTSGWIAQWLEMVTDDATKIARPRQIYTGARESTYKQIGDREKLTNKPVAETNLIDPAKK